MPLKGVTTVKYDVKADRDFNPSFKEFPGFAIIDNKAYRLRRPISVL